MRSPSLVFSILLLTPGLALLKADTITLKSGEAITGKILSESADQVQIEYKISSSITDQKTISRGEIEKIEKEQLDEVAYAAIQNLKVDPEWSMQASNYDRLIQLLQGFLTRYPQSAHAAEIKQNLDALTAERDRVANGELKLFGNWLTKDQAQKQHSQVEAQAAFESMREKAMQGDYVGALNIFEKIKVAHRRALIYPGAVQFASSTLVNLQRQVAAQKIAVQKEEQNWARTIAMTTEPQKSQFTASRNLTAQRAEAALAAAEKTGVKWTPIIPHSMKSLELLERNLSSEKGALATIPVAKMRESVTLANKAADALAAKDYSTAETLLKNAQQLWFDNSALDYVKNELAVAKATPTPTATPQVSANKHAHTAQTSIAPTPTPEPEQPFFKTTKGASIIVVGVLLVVGLGSLLLQLLNKPKERNA